MLVQPSLAEGGPPSEWLVEMFFEQFSALAQQVRSRCGTRDGYRQLADALVRAYQSRDSYPQHLAQAWLDPFRYEAVSHELLEFGKRLVESAQSTESLELVICWLSYARQELLETLRGEQALGSTGPAEWKSSRSPTLSLPDTVAA